MAKFTRNSIQCGINMYKAPQMVGLLSLYLPHYMPSAFHMGSQSSVIVLTFLKEAMELAELQRRNESQKLDGMRVVKDADPH